MISHLSADSECHCNNKSSKIQWNYINFPKSNSGIQYDTCMHINLIIVKKSNAWPTPNLRQYVNYNLVLTHWSSYRYHLGGALWRTPEAETQQDSVHQSTAGRPRENLLQDALPGCRHEGASRHDDQSPWGQNTGKTRVGFISSMA